ncbi:MAG: hypothetical protein AAGF92_22165 [Myxococcota bacterium]
MATKTYELKELAGLLNFHPAHCKVMVKQYGADPTGPIDEEVAAKVAKRVRRPWPPQVEAEAAVVG